MFDKQTYIKSKNVKIMKNNDDFVFCIICPSLLIFLNINFLYSFLAGLIQKMK